MSEEQFKEDFLCRFSLENTPRKRIFPCYYSAIEIFEWLSHADPELRSKWAQKMATDQQAPKEEKCAQLIDVIEHASECLSDMAPSRSKQRKVAKEISTLINTIIE